MQAAMTTTEIFARLGLALGAGLLIGIERGWQEREGKPGSRAAGIRTHALIGLLGGVWGLLAHLTDATVLGFAALAFAATFAFFEWREMNDVGSHSATGLVAGLLSFALGAYAILGDKFAAGSAAVAATIILAERRALHEFLEKLQWSEFRAALLLLAMSVVLLPVMPNRAVDPWGVLNPFQIWLMIVLIAAISYGGYIAVRLAGEQKGLLYAGGIGGAVSSTTVSWTFSRLAKQHPESQSEFAAGIVASWAVSLARVMIIVAIFSPALAFALVRPLTGALVVLCAATAILFWRAERSAPPAPLALEDPFDIFVILRFGLLLAVIMLAVRWLTSAFGTTGLFGLASVSGLADVDPIMLSMTRAAGVSVSIGDAALAVILAVGANTVAKCALAFVFGKARFGILLSGIALAGAGGAALMFLI